MLIDDQCSGTSRYGRVCLALPEGTWNVTVMLAGFEPADLSVTASPIKGHQTFEPQPIEDGR